MADVSGLDGKTENYMQHHTIGQSRLDSAVMEGKQFNDPQYNKRVGQGGGGWASFASSSSVAFQFLAWGLGISQPITFILCVD